MHCEKNAGLCKLQEEIEKRCKKTVVCSTHPDWNPIFFLNRNWIGSPKLRPNLPFAINASLPNKIGSNETRRKRVANLKNWAQNGIFVEQKWNEKMVKTGFLGQKTNIRREMEQRTGKGD